MLQKKISIFLLALLLTSNFIIIQNGFASTSLSELDDAKSQLISALKIVQEAEQKGINVQSYVNALNSALLLIKNAENQNASGNVTKAIENAKASSTISIQVEAEVGSYSYLASMRDAANFRSTVISSLIALIIAVIVISFSWILFKRRFLMKLLDMKPEVTPNES
jgi:hypothetical protein